ncbi:DUF3027 domain-containing protein [Amycolatopsis sp. NPDC051045]|uniref:DUF3027 domain-containing protein n=1 Tax=Amycolatopsis sp. NPDC051045 TaxID=3156922 RepID=UPI0034277C30
MTLLLTLDDGSVQRKLADAVEFARAAVLEEAPEEQLGAHVGVTREDAVTASHLFEAQVPGYGGWRWSVTMALAGDDEPVTVSEVVLVPGPSALVAPAWVPWERRVRAGDLGVGDIFPTDENDPRLAPAYLQSDDPAVEEVAHEAGLGRIHVLSRFGRTEAAARWHAGEFGPRSDMARSAPDVCGTCGFFVPLAGSLRGVFGVCSNDIAPADGHVVDVEYGCGAHSEVEVEVTSSVPVAELVYDDSLLDFTPAPAPVETAAAEPETGIAESDVSPAEVEPEVVAEISEPEPEPEPEPESAAVESADAVAEPEVTGEVAEPGEAVEAVAPVDSEASEVADPAAAVAEPVAAEPVAAESSAGADEVAEPGEGQASEVTEPVEASAATPEVTDEVTEPVVAEVPEPAEAEPTQAEVTDAAELRTTPEPLGATTEATTEPDAAEVPVAAESDAAEVDPVPAEVADLVGEPQDAEAEPVQAEVADGADEPQDAEAAQAEVADVAGEPQEVEVPEAALTDNVVTTASEAPEPDAAPAPDTGEADEAQAQVDNTPER